MSADFTPGPWRFNGNWLEPVDYRGGDLILTYTSSDDGLHGKEADKALIAAAPELYAALERLINAADSLADDANRSSADEAIDAARAALAKAARTEFGNIGADGVQS